MPPNTTITILLLALITISVSDSVSESTSSAQIRTHPNDIWALKALKSALTSKAGSIPGSCLASWNFSVDPCAAAFSDHFTCGLRCTTTSPIARVTDLTLDPAGYSGSLPPAALRLPFIQTLSLADNFLSGELPGSIFSNLTKLQKLVLSRNQFSGSIPDSTSALTHLEELCLDNNNFEGQIPTKLKKLQRLKRLELQQNRLSGPFPKLGSLKDLYFLDASDNELVGEIAPAMFPDSLIELSLRNNSFSSYSPEMFTVMKNLQVLDLSHNQLSGSVSGEFFKHTSLQQLTLSHNNLSSIDTPEDAGVQSSLISVDLSNNKLAGSLPEFMATLPALTSLSLEQNMLTGDIPSNYAKRAAGPSDNTASFGRLLLGGNYLFGLIPGPLTSLKPGRVNVSLADNCLYLCPDSFFFCQGGNQKSMLDCNRFRHFNINKRRN